MKILRGMKKIIFAPVYGLKKIPEDFGGEHGQYEQGIALASCGLTSILLGTIRSVKKGWADIFTK